MGKWKFNLQKFYILSDKLLPFHKLEKAFEKPKHTF